MSDQVSPSRVAGNLRFAFILAGIQVAGAVLLVLARKQELIDQETTTRSVMVLIGLGLAATGNRMPKSPDGPPSQSLTHAAMRQSVLRVGGWAMMLGGLAFTGVWLFAPRDMAQIASIAAVGAGVIVTVGYLAWRMFNFHRAKS